MVENCSFCDSAGVKEFVALGDACEQKRGKLCGVLRQSNIHNGLLLITEPQTFDVVPHVIPLLKVGRIA